MQEKQPAISFLRHYLATCAYRFQKSISGSPARFDQFDAGNGVRKPIEILNHMTGVLGFVIRTLGNIERKSLQTTEIISWEEEIRRFHQSLTEIDELLGTVNTIDMEVMKNLMQGPLTDVMTHIGQLAMLRRLAESPIPREDFTKAKIMTGNTSEMQQLKKSM